MKTDKKAEIEGGAILLSRQVIMNPIFYDKPAVWFKVWIYLLCRVSHKDTKKYKKGETFIQTGWICEGAGATKDQVKKCLAWLRKSEMISTARSTRGTWIKITNYSRYQRLNNYYYGVEAPQEAPEKHQRSTREAPRYNKNEKNEKNEKNILQTEVCEVIPDLLKDKNKHVQIIGLYARAKKIDFQSSEQQTSFIKRNLRPAKNLDSYNFQKITETMAYLINNADFKWTLESVGKFIDEDLNNLNNKGKTYDLSNL